MIRCTSAATADVYSHLDFSAKIKAAKTIASVYDEPQQPKEQAPDMDIFAAAIKEMQELGIEKLEDYIAYKEQTQKKKPIQM